MPRRARLVLLLASACACDGQQAPPPGEDLAVEAVPPDLAALPDLLPGLDLRSVPDLTVVCAVDSDCRDPALPRCDAMRHGCAACLPDHDNCPDGHYCLQLGAGNYVCAPGCKSDGDCLSDPAHPHCDPISRGCLACVTDDQCPDAQLCLKGSCGPGCGPRKACPAPLQCCDGGGAMSCTDTGSDVMNCGGCGMECQGGWNCCDALCSNPTNDILNCGACGIACSVQHGTPACMTRACVIARCDPGWAHCAAGSDCETHTDVDQFNCGACHNACPNGVACVAGTCQINPCAPGFADCNKDPKDGCEVNLENDSSNCGQCGVACPMGQRCIKGACA